MKKGGYKIIDLKDKPLTTGGAFATIAGIYQAVENNYRKPLLLSGINFDGVEKPDVFTTAYVNGANITMQAYGKTVTIANNDQVSIANASEGMEHESKTNL